MLLRSPEGGATTTNNPVVWFEIYVADMERAKAFYQGVLAMDTEGNMIGRHSMK